MEIFSALILAWIAYIDFRFHRIPNVLLIILLLINAVRLSRNLFQNPIYSSSAIIALLLLSVFCGLGMGDVKLLSLLIVIFGWANAGIFMQRLIAGICMWVGIYSLFLLASRSFSVDYSRNIPLAPPISAAAVSLLFKL